MGISLDKRYICTTLGQNQFFDFWRTIGQGMILSALTKIERRRRMVRENHPSLVSNQPSPLQSTNIRYLV
jgi:hypothetical protein